MNFYTDNEVKSDRYTIFTPQKLDKNNILFLYDMYNEDLGISIMIGIPDLKIGESYLFLTTNFGCGKYDFIINTAQFAFNKKTQLKNQLFSYEEVTDYVKNMNK